MSTSPNPHGPSGAALGNLVVLNNIASATHTLNPTAAAALDAKTAQKFLKSIREGSGYLAYREIGGQFKQVWFKDHDQAIELAGSLACHADIWISVATFPDQVNPRKAKFAGTLCSYFLDIDAHESSAYKSVKEVEQALDHFVTQTGLPAPPVILRTGHGLHAYWPLAQKLPRDVWVEQASLLQQLAQTLNLGADPITADAARVLRLAGTINFRDPANPQPTRLIRFENKLIESEDFEKALQAAIERFPPPLVLAVQTSIRCDILPTAENIAIVDEMLSCIDPDPNGEGGGNRARWRQGVFAVAALGWGDIGFERVRKWSQSGDLYDAGDLLGVWRSFDPNWRGAGGKRATGVGTLVMLARQAGYSGPPLRGKGGSFVTEDTTDSISFPEADRPNATQVGRLITRVASDIEPEKVEWLVEDSIPLGCLVVIAGQPGLGKSQIAINLATGVTTGKGLPKDQRYNNLGTVIILANEDDAARTIRPRLDAAGADVSKVHIVEGVARVGERVDFFQLDTDVETLREKASQLGDVRLVIVDPPTAYLGPKSDSYKDSDVRRVLAPLSQLAQETGALVLLVVHVNKRTDGGPQQRIGGSVAWTAAPRAAFMALHEEESGQRYLVPVKNNLGDDRTGFPYRIEEKVLDYKDQKIRSSRIVWAGTSQVSASELLNPPRTRASPTKDSAKAFLEDELEGGPRKVTDLQDAAKGKGLAWSSVRRAKDDLLIMSKKLSDGWVWELLKGS